MWVADFSVKSVEKDEEADRELKTGSVPSLSADMSE